jgi:hypothetical protein
MVVEVVDAADCPIVNRARVRLSIDYGTASTTAVLAFTDGRRVPVVFDGSPLLPSGVWIDPSDGRILTGAEAYERARQDPACFVEHPKQCLADRRIHRAGRDIDPVDLAAAVLRQVADHAQRIAGGPVDDVVLTVPAGWGPRRANLLREAARRAGLPVPVPMPEPIAAACHLMATTATTVPAEGCVLVCDIGAGSADVSVVQRDNTAGWTRLSTITAPGAAGTDLDDAVVRHLTAPDGSDPDLWQRLSHPATADAARDRLTLYDDARQAKETLSRTTRAAVALPAPHPPVVLDRDHLDTLARPLADQVVQAANEAVAAADITAEHLAAVVLVGGAARTPHLSATLHDRFGITPVLLDPPALAVADGSLHTTGAATTAVRPAPGTPTPVFVAGRPPLRQLAGILALGIASLALLIQTLATADNYPNPGGTIPGVLVINGAEYAMAALCAVLAAIAGAQFAASTLLHEDIDAGTPGQRARHAGQILSGAAVAGMAAAGLYGLLGGALFGLPSSRFLTWTLLAPLPAAAVTVVTGLLAPRIQTLTASPWANRLHHPVIPVTLAATGMLLAQAALSANLPWSTLVHYGPIAGPAGTGLLGVATALTAATRLWPRVGLGFLLGLGGAVVYNLPNTAILGAVYIIVVGAWWIVRAGRIIADAFPHARPTLRGWWKSLTGSSQPPHS